MYAHGSIEACHPGGSDDYFQHAGMETSQAGIAPGVGTEAVTETTHGEVIASVDASADYGTARRAERNTPITVEVDAVFLANVLAVLNRVAQERADFSYERFNTDIHRLNLP